MRRYANILLDETFKVVLCDPSNKQLFMDMIELLVHKKLSDLTFLNIEQHGLALSDKNSNFDMLCRAADTGEEFIVEVQNRKQASFPDRMLSYATFPIRMQLAEKREHLMKLADGEPGIGEKREKIDYALRPVYVISIMDFALDHENDKALEEGLISRYSIREDASGELLTDALHFVFLELGRLKLKQTEGEKCRTLLERFAWSWKYMHKLEAIPSSFQDPLVLNLFHATEYASLPIEKQQQYDKAMTTELDIIAQRNYAIQQSRAEGRAEGRAETARKLKEMNVDPEIISKATGLSLDEVKKL